MPMTKERLVCHQAMRAMNVDDGPHARDGQVSRQRPQVSQCLLRETRLCGVASISTSPVNHSSAFLSISRIIGC